METHCESTFFNIHFDTELKDIHVTISYAKKWLIDTDYSIEELSQKLGFPSKQHFSQSFRANVGLSPLQLRQQLKLS